MMKKKKQLLKRLQSSVRAEESLPEQSRLSGRRLS